VQPPEEERLYFIAGHQHGVESQLFRDTTAIGARGANTFNMVDGSTALRAFLINLDRWVSAGVEPPPSTFPRLADGTAVTREVVLEQFRRFPGVALLDPAVLPRLRRLDLGPRVSQGIARVPAETGQDYPTYVPAVDEDGNEVCGIRLPDVTVPVATNTGWVPRHPDTGGSGQLLDMMGTTLPFPRTPSQRQASGDPRRAIAERYRDRDEYVARARQAARALAQARYILEEDVDLAVELAAARYDALAPTLARSG
jgi:hypothetical protein